VRDQLMAAAASSCDEDICRAGRCFITSQPQRMTAKPSCFDGSAVLTYRTCYTKCRADTSLRAINTDDADPAQVTPLGLAQLVLGLVSPTSQPFPSWRED
jgi:hypothetical protein